MRLFLCSCMTDCCVPHKKSLILIAQILNFLYTVLLVFMTRDGLSYKHYLILICSFFVLLHDFFLSLFKLIFFLALVVITLSVLTLLYPFYFVYRCFFKRNVGENGELQPSLTMRGRSFFHALMGPLYEENETEGE